MAGTSPSFLGKERRNILHFIRQCIDEPFESPGPVSHTAMGDLLDQYLDTAVTANPEATEKLTSVLMHVYREIASHTRCSVRDCLLDAGTPVPILKEIKKHHKQVANTSRSEAERQVATVVYFAAIASALVFHRERITSYSNNEFAQAINRLSDESWIAPKIKALLQRASASLSRQRGS